STYATLSLMKGFARSVPLMRGRERTILPDEMLGEVPDVRPALSEDLVQRDELRQLLSRLSERERVVLQAHYGICYDWQGAAPAPGVQNMLIGHSVLVSIEESPDPWIVIVHPLSISGKSGGDWVLSATAQRRAESGENFRPSGIRSAPNNFSLIGEGRVGGGT